MPTTDTTPGSNQQPAAARTSGTGQRRPKVRPFAMRTQIGGMARFDGIKYAYEVECIRNHGRTDAVYEARVVLRNSGIRIGKAEFGASTPAREWCAKEYGRREGGE